MTNGYIQLYGRGYGVPTPRMCRSMHALRHRVFRERMGWSVDSRCGMERDVYDDHDPLNIVYVGPQGTALGMVRFLPTTGPNMLGEVFSRSLGIPPITDPFIWEASRFAVDCAGSGKARRGAGTVASSIIVAEHEVALMLGLTHIVCVYDMAIERLLRMAGCVFERIAEPTVLGKTVTTVGLFDSSPESLANVRARTGLGPQLFDDNELLEFAA